MRFLHTGDLHLDSSFSLSNQIEGDRRRKMQRDSLGRVFSIAKEKECEMILIAGDLFDSKYVTPETETYVIELFSSVNIPIVISPGNHDPFVGGSFYKNEKIPDNVYIFSSSELQRFDFPELRTRVYGYAFTSMSLTGDPLVGYNDFEDDGYIKLLCAHADVTSVTSRYCPITVREIVDTGVDYAALGHVHNGYGEELTGYSHIRYCGFPEGRSFDELHDGGVFIVDIEAGGQARIERCITSVQKYEIKEVDVSNCGSKAETISKLEKFVSNEISNGVTHLRIELCGTAEPDSIPHIEWASTKLSDKLISLEISDLTVPVADIETLRTDISIRGAFYNALYSGLVDADPKEREKNLMALKIGLAAIEGRSIPGSEDDI